MRTLEAEHVGWIRRQEIHIVLHGKCRNSHYFSTWKTEKYGRLTLSTLGKLVMRMGGGWHWFSIVANGKFGVSGVEPLGSIISSLYTNQTFVVSTLQSPIHIITALLNIYLYKVNVFVYVPEYLSFSEWYSFISLFYMIL
jgi:hypothetical protein